MKTYSGEGHNRKPDVNEVFDDITSEEITGALAIWDERNKETVVVSDVYVDL